jgi:hypothetical protein
MNKYNVIKEQSAGSKYVHQGFNMTLENNVYVSVMFGTGAYADQGETTAEVAVIDIKDDWYIFNGKELLKADGTEINPRITPNQLIEILNLAKAL